jgi:hypothetical protein
VITSGVDLFLVENRWEITCCHPLDIDQEGGGRSRWKLKISVFANKIWEQLVNLDYSINPCIYIYIPIFISIFAEDFGLLSHIG